MGCERKRFCTAWCKERQSAAAAARRRLEQRSALSITRGDTDRPTVLERNSLHCNAAILLRDANQSTVDRRCTKCRHFLPIRGSNAEPS